MLVEVVLVTNCETATNPTDLLINDFGLDDPTRWKVTNFKNLNFSSMTLVNLSGNFTPCHCHQLGKAVGNLGRR